MSTAPNMKQNKYLHLLFPFQFPEPLTAAEKTKYNIGMNFSAKEKHHKKVYRRKTGSLLLLALLLLLLFLQCPLNRTPSKTTFRVAAVQLYSSFGDTADNRSRMKKLILEAAAGGADIVVFPETALPGYISWQGEIWADTKKHPDSGSNVHSVARELSHSSIKLFSDLARQQQLYIALPFIEYDKLNKKYYNTLLLLGPGGKIVGHYRKLHPWPPAETFWASSGDLGLVTADTKFGRLGLLICRDMHWLDTKLAAAGADTLLYPVAWVGPPEQWFNDALPLKAKHNSVNIVAANWTFPEKLHPGHSGAGCSRIIDRNGRILTRAPKAPGQDLIIYADLPVKSR